MTSRAPQTPTSRGIGIAAHSPAVQRLITQGADPELIDAFQADEKLDEMTEQEIEEVKARRNAMVQQNDTILKQNQQMIEQNQQMIEGDTALVSWRMLQKHQSERRLERAIAASAKKGDPGRGGAGAEPFMPAFASGEFGGFRGQG